MSITCPIYNFLYNLISVIYGHIKDNRKHAMDEIRDIKKDDQIGRFLGTHIVRTNPFGRNISGEKAYSRAERIVSALHLLTNHVPQEEPVRYVARKAGLGLLSGILSLRDEMRVSNSSKTRVVQASIRELISLIRMLAISGFTSFQNSEVVLEALDELGNFLNVSQRSSLSENLSLRREDLMSGSLSMDRSFSHTSAVRTSSLSQTQSGTSVSDIKDIDSVKDINIKDKTRHPVRKTENVEGVETRVRSQEIIGILQSGGELGIRDIASNLTEYSEKMIQRELSSLVEKQLVKKTGVKRWSRYSLVR